MLNALVYTLTLFLCSCFAIDYNYDSYYNITCATKATNKSLTLEPRDELEIPGRYNLQWCGRLNGKVKSWELVVTVTNRSRSECLSKYEFKTENAEKHSVKTYYIEENYNCSITCLSTVLDLVYRGCYTTKNTFAMESGRVVRNYSLNYVNNTYDFQYFNSTEYLLSGRTFDNVRPARVVMKFYFGNVPVTDYSLELCNATDLEKADCPHIEDWCNPQDPFSLSCVGNSEPGQYSAFFQHITTWSDGDVFNNLVTATVNFCKFCRPQNFATTVIPPEPANVPVSGGSQVGIICGVVLLVVAAVAAGVLMCRADCRQRDSFKVLVQRGWRQRYAEIHKPVDVTNDGPEVDSVLLLYARDCESLMKAASTLRDLIRAHTHYTVYDLHSPSTMNVSATSPNLWLQAAITHPRVRIVLLETHTAKALYSASCDVESVSPPLLGGRARYRRATAADSLLQYALRLLQDRSHETMAYRKYFVARISSMPADVHPTVVPYRRYQLPEHTPALLSDLTHGARARSPATATPPREGDVERLADELAARLADFTQFVSEHPNYLADELMFF